MSVPVVGVLWPRALTGPLVVIGFWVAVALLVRAYRLHTGGALADALPSARGTRSHHRVALGRTVRHKPKTGRRV